MSQTRARRRYVLAPDVVNLPDNGGNCFFASFHSSNGRDNAEVVQSVSSYDQNPDLTTSIWREDISDVVGNPKGFNGVVHTQSSFRNHRERVCSFRSVWDLDTLHEVWSTGYPVVPYPTTTPLSARAQHDFAWDSFHRAVEQIAPQVSIGELTELPELADLWKEVLSLRKKCTGIVRALKAMSGVFLGYSFGVSPLRKEIENYFGLWKTTTDRIAFLKKTSGKQFVTRYSRLITNDLELNTPVPLVWFDSDVTHAMNLYGTSAPWVLPLVERHQLKSRMVVKNTLYGFDTLDSTLNAFGAALGLNNPLRLWWNKIPLSFIVEWFVNLDNVFFDISNNPVASPFKGSLEVVDSSHSIKSEWISNVYIPRPPSILPGFPNWEIEGELVNKVYYRAKGLPFGPYIEWGGELSSFQRALLAALAIQRV